MDLKKSNNFLSFLIFTTLHYATAKSQVLQQIQKHQTNYLSNISFNTLQTNPSTFVTQKSSQKMANNNKYTYLTEVLLQSLT